MDNFIIYILKACLGISLFVVPYFFLLRNDNALQLKRFFLLGGVFASFLFPLLALKKPAVVEVYSPVVSVEPDYVMPQMETIPVEVATGIEIQWPTVLLALYLCGLLILLFRNVFMLLKWNAVWKKAESKGRGVAYSGNDEIFAMFSRIFLPDRLQNTKEIDSILLHEKAHIRQMHFIDLIIAEAAMLLTWFNPFTWLLTLMVKENHEHLADRMVLEEGIDPVEYRTQLLNQTMGIQVFSLAHPFNRSSVKHRFDMMKQSKSIRSGMLKVAVLVPLILISLGMAVGKVRQGDTVSGKIVFSDTGEPAHGASVVIKNSTIGTVADEGGNYQLELKERAEVVFSYVGYRTQSYWFNPGEYRFVVLERDVVDLSQSDVQSKSGRAKYNQNNIQLPLFQGKDYAVSLREYIFNNINEPKLNMERLAESGFEISFIVDSNGKVLNIGVSTYYEDVGLPYVELTKFSKDVVNALHSSGPWTPAIINGESKPMKLYLRNSFWFPRKSELKFRADEEEVFYVVEEMPKFNNGDPAIEFRKYIAQNLRYPKEEAEKGIDGRVIVQFIVNADGSVSDIAVVAGVSPGLDSEAVRVVESSPPWTPGRQRGKAVAVKFAFPMNFVLDKRKEILPDTTQGDKEVFYIVEEMPKFNNGDPAIEFRKHVAQNLRYPKEEATKGISGRVVVQFVVNADGSVSNAEVVMGASPGLNNEAIRVVESSPLWTPGKQRGKTVAVKFTFPVTFTLSEPKASVPGTRQSTGNETQFYQTIPERKEIVPGTRPVEENVFYIVEEMPVFNNGDPAIEFRKYIAENLRYPKEEAEKGISGRVIVQFKVAPDGSVKDALVVVGASPGLDNEALRVVESSPVWTPGKQKGQAVNVLFTFPVNFVLQGNRTAPADSASQNLISRRVKPEFSYSRNSVKVINNPWHGHTSAPYLKIARIELSKRSTVLYFDVTFRPQWWIRVPENTYIRPGNSGKRLYLKKAEGIPFNEKFFMPDSGRTSFKLYFPPIDEDVSYIDYGEEENVQGSWYIRNIELIER